MYDKLMDLEGVTLGTEAYDAFVDPLEKILGSWKPSQGAKTQAIGDEVHVEGLLRGDRMKKNFEHFI